MNDDNLDDFIRNKVSEVEAKMPTSPLELELIWFQMEIALKQAKRKALFIYSVSVAACVSIAIVIAVIIYKTNPHEVKLSNRQGIVFLKGNLEVDENRIEKEVIAVVEQRCKVKNTIRVTNEFAQLTSELHELNIKSEVVKQEVKQFGQAPSVLKAQIKIKNMKSDIIKKLLKL